MAKVGGSQGHKLLNCGESALFSPLVGVGEGSWRGPSTKKFIRQRTLSTSVNSQSPLVQNNTYAKVVYLVATYSDALISLILCEKSIPFPVYKFYLCGTSSGSSFFWSIFPGFRYKLRQSTRFIFSGVMCPRLRELNP